MYFPAEFFVGARRAAPIFPSLGRRGKTRGAISAEAYRSGIITLDWQQMATFITAEEYHDHRKDSGLYRLRDMRADMPHRRHPSGSRNKKGIHCVSGRLPDMPSVQDVLSCGCNHHFPGKIHSGCGFLGVG